jgi:hypothetical protein
MNGERSWVNLSLYGTDTGKWCGAESTCQGFADERIRRQAALLD